MKIAATRTISFGIRRYEEGDEVELPDSIAKSLVSRGYATEAGAKKAKKKELEPEKETAVEDEPPPSDKQKYSTRKMTAKE